MKTDQVSGGWEGLVRILPLGASLRQGETDSSRDMIIYRVDIGAFLQGGKVASGGSLDIFSFRSFFLGVRSGCFF